MIRSPLGRMIPVFLLLSPILAACGDDQAAPPPPPPPAVTVAIRPAQHHRLRRVCRPFRRDGRGRDSRARLGLSGAVHFRDGQIVKKGDLLFTIDRRPFENALARPRPISARPRPTRPLRRPISSAPQSLVKDRAISEQTFDQRVQAARSAEANMKAQEAAVAQAELDLQFTELRAPDRRPHRRPPRLAGQSRHRRFGRQHLAARHDRLDRSDPLRVHLRRGLLSALRARLARSPARMSANGSRAGSNCG